MALSTDPAKRDSQMIRLKATKAGMSEDQYKDWLRGQFGVASATELNERQRRQAHAHLGKLLDAASGRQDTGTWREPQLRKLDALWGALAARGAVRVNTREAMESWCKRSVPRLAALRFANSTQLQHLIESLKQWLLRVDPTADLNP